jgi:acetyl-CoA acyltransferase
VKEPVIVGYVRSPVARAHAEKGFFRNIRSDDLAGMVIKELVKRTGVKPSEVEDCVVGCANQTGEQWLYGGRKITWLAGLPFEVGGLGVDRQCASSLSAVHIASMGIMCDMGDVYIAAGLESLLHIPMGHNVSVSDMLLNSASFDLGVAMNMGFTAEKLFGMYKDKISKEDMDRWSLRSHELAAKAREEGFFKDEIMPIEVTLDGGTKQMVDYDQTVRKPGTETSLEKISSLPPAFQEGGVITAGNSSPLNDAAAAVMLMSKEKAKEYGLKPLATVKSMGWAGVDPTIMGTGPIPACRKAMKRAGLTAGDIDFWEINEAFAIVTLVCMKELGIDPKKVNVKGGAIAIGHPLGMSGARLVGTLARILNVEKGRYGVATACVGGGQGAAILLEKEEY